MGFFRPELHTFISSVSEINRQISELEFWVSTFTENSECCTHSRSLDKYAGRIVIGKADVFDGTEFSLRSHEIRS